ncbi:hypothetical protein P168DRAFT_305202 [Aspergillus campestris IBT 28561]|uniref:Conserved oligomeric Golgi complex subunit 2 n=1 Tax=Aspergillus campestris (strain IBT 28561) TaxID=1392248 RepID=A0A2I1D221_ASPC2|nr:uncharacterized protein P168DRAFT_305202 [Aspergillus campestris IBT 28561]PKY03907.1 hypothetical protein P168DRAFT_305202 [Aspergillus campestris IBT 28561]
MNLFRFGEPDDSGSDIDDDPSGLPFPEPLTRSSFLAPDFDPAEYLSSLTNRHQSLEDLRQELRELDQLLGRELLDLVNHNYQDFLSLGSALHGGEEKVEQIRVGLLSFQRDVQTIRERVEARHEEMEQLLNEKRRLRGNANFGRALLDYADRVDELEKRLMIGEAVSSTTTAMQRRDADDGSGTDSDDGLDTDSEESGDEGLLTNGAATAPLVSLKRLEHHIQKYVYLTRSSSRLGDDHPFFVNQRPRISKINAALLLDLKTALEQASRAGDKQDTKTMAVLRLYNLMGEDNSAVSTLKNLKKL